MSVSRARPTQAVLVAAAVAISVLGEVAVMLRPPRGHALVVGMAVGYLLVLANVAIAVVGAYRTPHRAAWCVYLLASVAAAVLVGAATPLSLLGMAARLLL